MTLVNPLANTLANAHDNVLVRALANAPADLTTYF